MAKSILPDVIVLSDSEDDLNLIPVSPLTALRPKNSKPASAKRLKHSVKRLGTKQPNKQTKLDSFFQTLTVKSERLARTTPNPLFTQTKLNVKSSFLLDDNGLPPPKSVKPTKRAAIKGFSPHSKVANMDKPTIKDKPKITDLKGEELWKAVVAQRKKPKSLTAELNELEISMQKESSSLDDFENKLMTKQVVHSFPNDKLAKKSKPKDSVEREVEKFIAKYKEQIPLVISDEPIEETTPIFRPKERITIKKKKRDLNEGESNLTSEGLLTSTPTKHGAHSGNLSLDLFSDSSFMADEEAALCEDYGRHVVVDCSVGDINTVMLLKNMKGEDRTCELQGYWADTPIKAGDVVNIFGEFDSNGYICIDMKQNNMIVINPDYLVSGSVIASATTCVRRSVLGNRYKGYDAGNKYMLFGSILHEVFQKVLVSEIRDPVEMRKLAESIAHTSSYAHEMYGIEMTDKSLIDGIAEYIPPMSAFLNKHVGPKANEAIKISCVRDIEETIWSARYGMKGKIDVTVDSHIKGSTNTVPLELKTGRPSYSAEHKGQVTMYSMMLSEKQQNRANDKLKAGLLVYLKDGTMQEVPHSNAAIKGLVNLRNELCQGLLRGVSRTSAGSDFTVDPLPEPINQSRMCGTCAHLITCSLHQKVFKDFRAPIGHVMEQLVPETLEHLSQSHFDYFSKWSRLLLIESSVEAKWKTIRDLWTKTTRQRLSCGTCITDLTVNECTEVTPDRYRVVLTRRDSLFASKLTAGDMVVLSEANSKVIVIATGSLLEVDSAHVTLLIERKLSRASTYCIDKYDFYTGDGTSFTNLARLMENTLQSARLRSIIIDKKEVECDDFVDEDTEDKLEDIVHSLNPNQKHAVNQGLLTRDYLIIKGYPGTGKTSTVAALVAALRVQGMSVLITSYTHSAVDNILIKLKQKNVEFIRLGRTSRIHPNISPHSSEYLTKDLHTVDEVANFYARFHVVGTTCLGITHPMLSKRRFDVCIVDEASQIMQPVSLGPLFYASRFILVGDNQQLPPLIKSNDAKCLGMEETLLDSLDVPSITIELTQQYRMNEEIMRLCNLLIYDNKLECGTDEVKTNTLQSNVSVDQNDATKPEQTWCDRITSPSLEHSLMLINTSLCASSPSKATIHSNTEARIVCLTCQVLLNAGVLGDSIGVITPYQAQVQLIRSRLPTSDIEVNTVDQYQGRDKSVIVISFARTESSSRNGKSEGILSDLRRLNVAITRGKSKMILIGNIEVLRSYTPVSTLINILRTDQIIDLPLDWASQIDSVS